MKSSSSICPSYCKAKHHQLSYQLTTSRSTTPVQLLFADVWGPSPTISYGGFRYYLFFVDDFSRYTWCFPLSCKSEVVPIFISFKKNIENLLGVTIKAVQSDWGGEFRYLHTLLSSLGISHCITCPYAHPQNGTVEWKHRHIVDTSLALMAHSSAPSKFWADAFTTAVFLINRLPTPVLIHSSPYATLFGKPPDYLFLRTFGCLCWPNLRSYNRHKASYRSLPCVFLGYSPNHHGYMCFHLPTARMYISHDVLFDELVFPFSTTITSSASTSPSPSLATSLPILSSNPSLSVLPPHPISTSRPSPEPSSSSHVPSPPPLPTHPMHTRSKSNLSFSKTRTDDTIPWLPPQSNLTTTTSPDKPSSYSQDSRYADWCHAMKCEYDALHSNFTWKFVPPDSS